MTMLTLSEFRDLRPGDKIRLKHESWPEPIEGKVWINEHGIAQMGGFGFNYLSSSAFEEIWGVELLERAPRFYANVDRDPVVGDVCRLPLEPNRKSNSVVSWSFREGQKWYPTHCNRAIVSNFDHVRPLLIVDGETGLPVSLDDQPYSDQLGGF
jgi:hypothetical protein